MLTKKRSKMFKNKITLYKEIDSLYKKIDILLYEYNEFQLPLCRELKKELDIALCECCSAEKVLYINNRKIRICKECYNEEFLLIL